jgi:hypothetical protein
MEFALVLRELWGKKGWLAVGVLVSLIAVVLSIYQVQLLPPKLVKHDLQYSSASIQAFVDTPESFVGDVTRDITPGINRATVFANLMASPGAMGIVGRYAGIPGDQIWAAGPIDPTQQRVVVEPTATKRNFQVSGESLPYRIDFLANPNLPIVSIYTQAPTTAQAVSLANASVRGLNDYIYLQQTQQHIPVAARVVVRTIGPANGATVNGGIAKKLAFIVFVAAFAGWCVLVLIASRLRANWRRSGLMLQIGRVISDREGFFRAGQPDDAAREPSPAGPTRSPRNGSTPRPSGSGKPPAPTSRK